MKPQSLELFAGFGGVGIALEKMGYTVAAAVEREAKPAEVYQRNHPGTPVCVASVADVDYTPYYGVDLMHGSPPCQNFSQARDPNLPPHADADVGLEMIRAAAECRPRLITLENVPGYRNPPKRRKDGTMPRFIFGEICEGLSRLGYTAIVHPVTKRHHVYAWDKLGGPQARRRLMARWVRRDCLDDLPIEGRDLFATHCWGWALEPIARPTTGWYAALADLLAVMPDGKLAPWQERALIKGGWLSEDGRLLVGKMKHSTRGVVAAASDDPSFTVTAGMQGTRALFVGGRLDRKTGAVESVLGDSAAPVITTKMLDTRALLLPKGVAPRGVVGDGFLSSRVKEEFEPANTVIAHRGELTALLFPRASGRTDDNGGTADQPSPTLKALGHCQHYRQFDAMLSDASVKCLDTRCLARLQGFPDWFELPDVAYVAGKGIGNAVPPPMYQAIVGPMLRAIVQPTEVAA